MCGKYEMWIACEIFTKATTERYRWCLSNSPFNTTTTTKRQKDDCSSLVIVCYVKSSIVAVWYVCRTCFICVYWCTVQSVARVLSPHLQPLGILKVENFRCSKGAHFEQQMALYPCPLQLSHLTTPNLTISAPNILEAMNILAVCVCGRCAHNPYISHVLEIIVPGGVYTFMRV